MGHTKYQHTMHPIMPVLDQFAKELILVTNQNIENHGTNYKRSLEDDTELVYIARIKI